jgi:hypothetical protein
MNPENTTYPVLMNFHQHGLTGYIQPKLIPADFWEEGLVKKKEKRTVKNQSAIHGRQLAK